MSYDRALLASECLKRLRRTPSISLDFLAREMHISRRTLQNAFLESCGKCFKKVQRELLISVVTDYFLREPTLTVKELSYNIGYTSARSFARAIKQACGKSPSKLRATITEGFCVTTQ